MLVKEAVFRLEAEKRDTVQWCRWGYVVVEISCS